MALLGKRKIDWNEVDERESDPWGESEPKQETCKAAPTTSTGRPDYGWWARGRVGLVPRYAGGEISLKQDKYIPSITLPVPMHLHSTRPPCTWTKAPSLS